MVALWRRPFRARQPGAVPGRELRAEPAWRSARPLRRTLSEPVPLVIAPGLTDRLATWRLARVPSAIRPAGPWTSLTPVLQPAWTRRRSGVRMSPDAAEFGPEVSPVWWRSDVPP